jgi:hypothetical protein
VTRAISTDKQEKIELRSFAQGYMGRHWCYLSQRNPNR